MLLPFVSGDNYLKPYVISEPEVTVTERTEEDECLILASDGLWDVVSNETACGVVRMCLKAQKPPSPPGSPGSDVAADGSDRACSDASILLTKLALARHSSDNVSVVVVDLRRDQRQSSNSNKLTLARNKTKTLCFQDFVKNGKTKSEGGGACGFCFIKC